MTARDEILEVARGLATRSADGTFLLMEILTEMRRRNTTYAESTIRTHVTSRMCANAPKHHAIKHHDLWRVEGSERGRYKLYDYRTNE